MEENIDHDVFNLIPRDCRLERGALSLSDPSSRKLGPPTPGLSEYIYGSQSANKCLATGLLGVAWAGRGKKPGFAVFAISYGVNTPPWSIASSKCKAAC